MNLCGDLHGPRHSSAFAHGIQVRHEARNPMCRIPLVTLLEFSSYLIRCQRDVVQKQDFDPKLASTELNLLREIKDFALPAPPAIRWDPALQA